MRSLKALILGVAIVAVFGSTAVDSSVNAQDTMLGKAGDKVTKTTKKAYSRGKRVGHTIGSRTWTGTKWVASNSQKGGKWVAVKTVNGTKWVYRKSKRAIVGTPARRP